jgi:Carboxypeptidase regulatory-like domain
MSRASPLPWRAVVRYLMVLLWAAALNGVAETPGSLCIANNPCSDVPAIVVLGTTNGGPAGGGLLKIEITSKPPVAFGLTMHHGGDEWELSRPARHAALPLSVHAGEGEYDVEIRAPRMRTVKRHVTIAREPSALRVVLEPLPVISGRIIEDATRKPVFGATVKLDGGEAVAALSDARGDFAFDADPDAWPKSVAVDSPGIGTATVPVPPSRRSASLLDIALKRAASLTIEVERPDTIGAVEVELYGRHETMRLPQRFVHRHLARAETSVAFQSIEPRSYVVVVRGREETEQAAMDIDVREDSPPVHVKIIPMQLELDVSRAAQPLPDARLRLSHWDGRWEAELKTDERGHATVPLWQAGNFELLILGTAMTTPFHASRALDAAEVLEWSVEIPSREIRGVVRDASSGEPVSKPNIYLRAASGAVWVTTGDGEGRFRFSAPPAAEYSMGAAADGYLPSPTLRYVINEGDGDREVELRVAPSSEKTIEVRDASGQPVAGAIVLDYDGLQLTGRRSTDADGLVHVPVPNGGRRRVFIVPREGAFALLALTSRDEARKVVRIADGPATIVVRTQNEQHVPIGDIWLLMRANGVALPIESSRPSVSCTAAWPFRTAAAAPCFVACRSVSTKCGRSARAKNCRR